MCSLTVLDLNSDRYLFIPITADERITFIIKEENNNENKRYKVFNWFESALMPVRTDKTHLIQDFLAPTLQRALKINNLAAKIIFSILAVIFDAITCPIRCLTVIPRAIYNDKREKHPLYKFLLEKGVNKNELDSLEYVHAHFSKESELGKVMTEDRAFQTDFTFRLKDLPYKFEDPIGTARGPGISDELRRRGVVV